MDVFIMAMHNAINAYIHVHTFLYAYMYCTYAQLFGLFHVNLC